MSRALALLHARLVHPATVDAFGCQVGLSRSALADRFRDILGVAPVQYLTHWRRQFAAQALHDSNKPILHIAQEVGYDPDVTVSRAFQRVMHSKPAKWRRAARDPDRAPHTEARRPAVTQADRVS